MQHENFINDLITGACLIFISANVIIFFPEHIGAILAFGLIGAAYLVMALIQYFDKF